MSLTNTTNRIKEHKNNKAKHVHLQVPSLTDGGTRKLPCFCQILPYIGITLLTYILCYQPLPAFRLFQMVWFK